MPLSKEAKRRRDEYKPIYRERWSETRKGSKDYFIGYGDEIDPKTGASAVRSWFEAGRVGNPSIELFNKFGPSATIEAWKKQKAEREAQEEAKKPGKTYKEDATEAHKKAKLEEEAAREAASAHTPTRSRATSITSTIRTTDDTPVEQPKKRGRGRPRKVPAPPAVDSSSTTVRSAVLSPTPTPSQSRLRNLRSSTRIASWQRGPSPQVQPTPHSRESLEGAQYWSQPTQVSSTQSPARTSPVLQSRATSSFRETGCVLESEPEDEEDEVELHPSASYVPTQTTGGTSQSAATPPQRSNPSTYEVRTHLSLIHI